MSCFSFRPVGASILSKVRTGTMTTVFLAYPQSIQARCLNFIAQPEKLNIFMCVSKGFREIMRDPLTWANVRLDFSNRVVPTNFFQENSSMLQLASCAVVTVAQSCFAAQLHCPLHGTWHAAPPWGLRSPRGENLVTILRSSQGRRPTTMISITAVPRTIELWLWWTGSLERIDIGLTNADNLYALNMSFLSANTHVLRRAYGAELTIQETFEGSLRPPGIWYLNAIPLDMDQPINIGRYVEDFDYGHHRVCLTMRWDCSRISISCRRHPLSTAEFGEGVGLPNLDEYMFIFARIIPSRHDIGQQVCMTPCPVNLGSGLRIWNALCSICHNLDAQVAIARCSRCELLFCLRHGGQCVCRFTGCGLCMASHECNPA